MTQNQINNIKQGLGKHATYQRFVARSGKTPIDPITGYGAKSNNPATWGTLEQSLACVGKNGIDGIGVELSDGLCGIDIDHCINEQGEVNELAQDIVSIMNGGYVEISPSGTGLHIIFSGTIPKGSRRKGNVEMYAEGRYFTLTGNGKGIATELSEQAAQVHKKYLAQTSTPTAEASPCIQLSLSDDELLKKISTSKNAPTVEALWHGDISRYKSQSEADIALCNILAFWTGRDAGQIDRLYRTSGLYREKWDRPQSGSTYGRLTIQKAIDDCHEVYQSGYKKSVAQNFSNTDPELWEKPTPFDEYAVGSFTKNALPKSLGDMAEASATATQTPLAINYVAVLATAAITVQGKYKVQITSDYSEPLNIYVAAVAPPAERKSAVLRNATQPLQVYEAQQNELKRSNVIRSAAEFDILMRQQEEIKKKASKIGDISALESIAKEIAEFKQEKLERFICDDATPEALTSLMADNNGCIGLISAEGGVFANMHGRYRENGGSDIDVYLKAHAGDTIRIDRKSRPAEYINSPCLTMLLTIQPVLIEGLMSNPEFKGRGLTARFLYVVVDDDTSLVGTRTATAPEIPKSVKTSYENALFSALNHRPQEPQPIYLSNRAEQYRQSFFAAIEPRLKDDLYFMSDWAGKLTGTVCRIAGILHCYSCDNPADTQISGETMMHAVELGFCFLQHAQAAYGTMGGDQSAAAAKYVLKRLDGMKSITKRNLHQLCRGRFKKVDELEPIITALIDHGYLRESTPTSEGAGRKPSPTYLVNPLLSQNTQNSQKSGVSNE
ncbi:MAG: DUF3987 domain-containing protein [Bacillota bacterium]|nr:DUF3987 domain-containing protein [Bacillota bacterium]